MAFDVPSTETLSAAGAETRAAPAPPSAGWFGTGTPTAVMTWLLGLILSMLLVEWLDMNPLSLRGAVLPVAAWVVAGAAFLAVMWRIRSDHVVGALAGAFGAWLTFATLASLNGTPHGHGGLLGDNVRIGAMATRYADVAWHTADPVVADIPAEYPPLYPWVIGQVSALSGVPAWRLLGIAAAAGLGFAVVVGFALWRRLVPGPYALAIVALGVAVFHDPRKAYEVVVLAAFLPWVLVTFAAPKDRQLHWLPAGVIGGLMVLTYHGFFLFTALGLVALVVVAWRTEPDRRGYLTHVAAAVGVAFICAAWYVVPFLYSLAVHGGDQVADLYESMSLTSDPVPLPFLRVTPLGIVELAGLAGLVWLRGRTWWARPTLVLLIGAYAYVVLGLVRFATSGHTMVIHYVTRLVGVVLVAAAVLTLRELIRKVSDRPAIGTRRVGVAALAVLLCWSALDVRAELIPVVKSSAGGPPRAEPADAGRSRANAAHVEPYPQGRLPAYAADGARGRWLPVPAIREAVEAVRGAGARPVVLSADDRLFVYLPWYGYLTTDRTSTGALVRWDDRHAEVARLAEANGADEFAALSSGLEHGAIDVFLLRRSGGQWAWRRLTFKPSQFDPAVFEIVDDLPNGYVLAIRRR